MAPQFRSLSAALVVGSSLLAARLTAVDGFSTKTQTLSSEFKATPDGLVTRAKVVLASDLGIQDESLLDGNFIWIGPNLGSSVLDKRDYIAAGKFFNLRASFPDLDYRAHDFRIDEEDPWTVRVTARMVGTMRGELRLRNQVLPPNGKQMQCPPEAITMTFDPSTGKLVKLCSGFTMDRLVGNSLGLCGVMAAAAVAGAPPSDWEIYPATTVVKRFFGRPVSKLPDPPSVLAPFPETVMIQLAKGILSADMAAADPDLLASSFTYCGPYEGPIAKKNYIEKVARDIFDGIEPQLSHFRVDPYDPYRVWVDVRLNGVAKNGARVEGSPQAISFTFDDDGFCTRLTAGAVMDPSIGSMGGLGGKEGIRYASGEPLPGIVTRPLPEVVGRLRKTLISPVTKVGVDEFALPRRKPKSTTPRRPSPPPASPVDKAVVKPAEKAVVKPMQKLPSPVEKAAAKAADATPKIESAVTSSLSSLFDSAPIIGNAPDASQKSPPVDTSIATKKAKEQAVAAKQAASAKQAQTAAATAKAKAEAQRKAQQAKVEAAKQRADEAKAAQIAKAAAAAVAAKKRAEEAKAAKQAKAEALQASKEAKAKAMEEQRAKARADVERRAQAKASAEADKKAKAAAKAVRTPANTEKPSKSMEPSPFINFSRTISLPKLELDKKEEIEAKPKEKAPAPAGLFSSFFSSSKPTSKSPDKRASSGTQKIARTAPKGVPTLRKWKENRDGTVTGLIAGSDQFEDGQRVTTSEISTGILEAGTVVKTASGSRYFLE